MQLSQASAEKIMKDMCMEDMPLISMQPTPHQMPADWFARYKKSPAQFYAKPGRIYRRAGVYESVPGRVYGFTNGSDATCEHVYPYAGPNLLGW